jgi:exodeoxyribonuclease-3
LQETKLTDPDFPTLDIAEAGYQAVFAGQKTYNGVAILSRLPASEIVTDLPGLTIRSGGCWARPSARCGC